MRTYKMYLAALALTAIAAPAAAQTPNVTGTWTASFVTSERTYPARIQLKQDSDTLSGVVDGGAGTEGNKLTGSIEASDLTFAFSTQDPSGSGRMLAIAVKASVGNDGLTGSFDVDGAPSGTFSAKPEAANDAKAPAAKAATSGAPADVAGTWAFTVDLGSITASPTVLLKQDAGTLTGTYTSQQYGQFPLKGTVKGNQVEFNFTMSIDGNSLDVVFSGTADKDGLTGTVNYGGIGEGTFTGKKKS
jgi:hypothetical protein